MHRAGSCVSVFGRADLMFFPFFTFTLAEEELKKSKQMKRELPNADEPDHDH